jgi:hypothetical protein
MTALSATRTEAPAGSAQGFCDLAKPFYWSSKDTDASIEQAKAHNAIGKAKCGWGASK